MPTIHYHAYLLPEIVGLLVATSKVQALPPKTHFKTAFWTLVGPSVDKGAADFSRAGCVLGRMYWTVG